MYFHNQALDLHLTTMTVKQVASFHAPLKREDTSVKTTEQQVMNNIYTGMSNLAKLV